MLLLPQPLGSCVVVRLQAYDIVVLAIDISPSRAMFLTQ